MKALIIFDSVYGNTEQIARTIGSALEGEVKVAKINEVSLDQLQSQELLIIGSPTQGGRPTKPVLDFLANIPENGLSNLKIAIFDTRLTSRWVSIFGYAAGRIQEALKSRKDQIITPAQGFQVKGSKGPLQEGELDKAKNWAQEIQKASRK